MSSNPIHELEAFYGPAISRYTRETALQDGVLIELCEEARRRAQCFVPVAVTRAVHGLCVAWTPEQQREHGGDEVTRAEYLIGHMGAAFKKAEDQGRVPSAERFAFPFAHRFMTARGSELVRDLRAVLDGDDQGRPCLTIMLPEET